VEINSTEQQSLTAMNAKDAKEKKSFNTKDAKAAKEIIIIELYVSA